MKNAGQREKISLEIVIWVMLMERLTLGNITKMEW